MARLVVDSVTKRYGTFTAVDGVSFVAEPGRIFGLLGPNGAGKTSTIRMITYITVPDAGRILLGDVPAGPETQRRMGYLPEERGLYKKLTVGEQLRYLAQLKGLARAEADRRIGHWLERFDLAAWRKKKVEELSKGMQQKVQFIATVLHEPALLNLDEPFSGLDPINSEVLQVIIAEVRAANRTILFASHRLEQVERLCDDVCLIAHGRVLLQGPLREVKRRFGTDTLTLAFDGPAAFLDELEAEGLAMVLTRTAGQAELRLQPGTPPRAVLERALARTREVTRFDLHEPPLEEIFKQAVRAAAPSASRSV